MRNGHVIKGELKRINNNRLNVDILNDMNVMDLRRISYE